MTSGLGADTALRTWLRALEATKDVTRTGALTLAALVRDNARTNPDAIALIDEDTTLSYAELVAGMDECVAWAASSGVPQGGTFGLVMPNRAAFPAIWLGLSGAGYVVALANHTLSAQAIARALAGAGCHAAIIDAGMDPAIAAALAEDFPVTVWSAGHPPAKPALAGSPAPVAKPPCGGDTALLIFTSGTTGMPKAARLSHARIMQWSLWFAGLMDVSGADRLYDCLPLYHGTGGVSALGAMLARGASVVIRRRFSARRFWADVADTHCTIFQYIGELCRYLAAAPPDPAEGRHRLRLFCGNGLRGEVWDLLDRRFAVPRILEFYGATEGAVSLYNCDGRRGAIGRVPGFLAHRFPIALVRCDPATGALLRSADGLCQPCDADEPGEALGRLDPNDPSPARHFEGYTDHSAADSRITRSVLAPGDIWYRTGDLMRRDADGFFWFIDRLGDSFRWKGELVSSTDVAATLCRAPGVHDAVVYPVQVPAAEGRAGMAAIVIGEEFTLEAFAQFLTAALPDYARPLFLRRCSELATTATFKPVKAALMREGYSNTPAGTQLWIYDRSACGYGELTDDLRLRLAAGNLRL